MPEQASKTGMSPFARSALLLTAFATAGCMSRPVRVHPSQAPLLVEYARGRTVIVKEPRQAPIEIRPEMAPELSLQAKQPCLREGRLEPGRRCDASVTAPLTQLTSEGSELVLSSSTQPGCLLPARVAVGAISSAWVVIGHDKIPIPRDELPGALVYGKTRTLSLRSGDRTIAVRPAQRPLLEMLVDKDACARIAVCERGRVVQRLENVSLEEGALRFCEYENGDIVAEPLDLVAVELRLKNAPPFVPRWGAGVDIGGAAIALSVTGQWYPSPWLVFEAGVFPGSGPALVGYWAGLRGRAKLSESVVLSGGASAGILADPNPEGSHATRLVGPRLAPEFVLPSRRDVIRLEFQAAYGNLLSESNRWFPWGGVAYARWF